MPGGWEAVMPHRDTFTRIVDRVGSGSLDVGPFNLWWAALSAAEETIQGAPLERAWLRLFRAHLSDAAVLRWRGDLAGSAEMRRAYSALYGRFFGRAVLYSRLGLRGFVPIDSEVTYVGNGVEVRRVAKGDVPDWIAWERGNPASYVLAEAKGRLTGSDATFLRGQPPCVSAGKAQFDRVVVLDGNGRRIRTKNWVVAHLWSTERRKRRPVSLLWDPDGDGEELSEAEVPQHALGIRTHRISNVAAALGHAGFAGGRRGRPSRTVRIAAQPSAPTEAAAAVEDGPVVLSTKEEPFVARRRPADPLSDGKHEDEYLAAVITRFGVSPILAASDVDAARMVGDRARRENEPALIYGISSGSVAAPTEDRMTWLSGTGVAGSDGAGLFDLRAVELDAD